MKLYHGTSSDCLESIAEEGVEAPSYWGTREQALQYAGSFGEKGVLLVADLNEDDLRASMEVALCMREDGSINDLPDEDDLAYSLEYLGGVTCNSTVRFFDVEECRSEYSAYDPSI